MMGEGGGRGEVPVGRRRMDRTFSPAAAKVGLEPKPEVIRHLPSYLQQRIDPIHQLHRGKKSGGSLSAPRNLENDDQIAIIAAIKQFL